ncbi:uncharacterized protein [Notothenia coriiceps]|uniref:Uncharacterized protein n=1 Tax=Notothenia coriiceps TaxID=8208 RepID=A0A6I9PR09_9TELE|nr:PREDICTED: uncharacterized protein LOC104963255 [Notothenia coriiceps]
MIAEKWLSLNNHIINIHTKHGRVFEKCAHGRLPAAQNRKKKWLKADSVPALKLNKVVSQKAFVRDVKKMSPSQQTYGVEVYHSIVNQFAPKMYAYSYTGIYCRLILAALHYNENSGRKHAKTRTGQLQYTVKFPKAKKGGHVVRRVNTAATYEYVTELLTETLRLCENNVDEEPFDVPDPLSSRWEKPDKREAVALFRSRFNH